jgi:hypothetical protein
MIVNFYELHEFCYKFQAFFVGKRSRYCFLKNREISEKPALKVMIPVTLV